MALSGNGFFVTQSASGLPDYTRAGDFTTNKAGQITTPSGELVLGYPATNGVVNTAATLQPLQVGTGVTSPAVASTTFDISANLNASSAVGDTASSTLPVFDSLGASHTLSVTYTMTAPNTWSYAVTIPSADLIPASSAAATTTVASGTLNFNSSGVLTSTLPTGGAATGRPIGRDRSYHSTGRRSPRRADDLCRWRRNHALDVESGDGGRSHHHPDLYGQRDQCHQHQWFRQRHAPNLRCTARRHHQWHFLKRANTRFGTGRRRLLCQQPGTCRHWQQQLPGDRCLWSGRSRTWLELVGGARSLAVLLNSRT